MFGPDRSGKRGPDQSGRLGPATLTSVIRAKVAGLARTAVAFVDVCRSLSVCVRTSLAFVMGTAGLVMGCDGLVTSNRSRRA